MGALSRSTVLPCLPTAFVKTKKRGASLSVSFLAASPDLPPSQRPILSDTCVHTIRMQKLTVTLLAMHPRSWGKTTSN